MVYISLLPLNLWTQSGLSVAILRTLDSVCRKFSHSFPLKMDNQVSPGRLIYHKNLRVWHLFTVAEHGSPNGLGPSIRLELVGFKKVFSIVVSILENSFSEAFQNSNTFRSLYSLWSWSFLWFHVVSWNKQFSSVRMGEKNLGLPCKQLLNTLSFYYFISELWGHRMDLFIQQMSFECLYVQELLQVLGIQQWTK